VSADREAVQELFLDALEREDPTSLEAWIRARAPSEEVAREVLSLLAAHGRPSPFDALAAVQDARDADHDGTRPGTRFGPWEVVGELGRGGMGVVYLVRRADGQFDQEGALKILPGDLAGGAAEARFLAERQILAGLSHAHVAQLLDGGMSPDGRPFFVMERVDGAPIDAYCDTRRLDVRERARLFLSVCAAVQYAHQNLIVHRDLKPSNILVTPEGTPKLLDFGIAKLLENPGVDRPTDTTQLTGRFLTPEYASPEQLLGRSVTTASDVYQLGVVLYVLLAGRPPFAMSRPLSERMEEALSASTPEPPSRGLDRAQDAGERAAARGTTVEGLRRRLSGDLDAIVSKAIRPEPGQRYGTAGHLADDLIRYLERRPVRARPDSALYRAGRFVRRHPAGLTAAVGVFLAVLAFATGVRRQARVTALERDRAEQVIGMLTQLFSNADPYVARGSEVTVREVLDRGAQRARKDLADQPIVQATLMEVIGDVYRGLGLGETSVDLLGEALDLRRRAQATDGPDLARNLRRLAMVEAEAGRFEAADTMLPVALDALRAHPPSLDVEYAGALNDIGYAWQVLGDLDRAEPLLEEALARFEAGGAPPAGTGATLTNLGNVRQARGDLDSAAVLFRRSVETRRLESQPEDPRLANSLESLASVLSSLGSLDQADSAATEALRIRRRVLPEGHPSLAGPIYLRGMIMRGRGRLQEAERLLREAVEIRAASLGEDHFVVASSRNGLALVLQDLGRNEEAAEMFRNALAVYAARFGPDHPNPVVVELNLARLLLRMGSLEEARAHYEHGLPIARRTWPDDRGHAGDLVDLGLIYCRSGEAERADETLGSAVEALRPTSNGPAPDDFLRALNAHGSCLSLGGQTEEAERVLRESLEASSARPDDDPYRAFALRMMARLGKG
jgi:tetratricopeptide (TPR) repeat protein